MDVTEYFLPPGRHLLDACGDSGFDTSVDGLAVLFSQRAEGPSADAGFKGRVRKVGKGGWVWDSGWETRYTRLFYIIFIKLCRVYFWLFQKGVKLGRQTRPRKESRWELLTSDFLVNMRGTIQSVEAPEQSTTESVPWWDSWARDCFLDPDTSVDSMFLEMFNLKQGQLSRDSREATEAGDVVFPY